MPAVIDVRRDHTVPDASVEYARHRLERALERVVVPSGSARFHLSQAQNPAHSRPVSARLEVDLDGRRFHAHADAATFTEAIDLAADRFAHELAEYRSRLAARQRQGADPSHGHQP